MQTQIPAQQTQQHQSQAERKSPQSLLSQFEDSRPEATAQLRMQSLMANSAQSTQLKSMQAMMAANTPAKKLGQSPGAINPIPLQRMKEDEPLQAKTDEPVQRDVDVAADEREGSVVITANGVASDFADGENAEDVGWNGVEKYKARAKVGSNADIVLSETNNNYLVAQAGHVLAQQNGGDGGDADNVFAQDGGVNNGPFRTNFENPMRAQLNRADEDDPVRFRAVLYGDEITQEELVKESDRLAASEEDTDFEGFSSEGSEEGSEESSGESSEESSEESSGEGKPPRKKIKIS